MRTANAIYGHKIIDDLHTSLKNLSLLMFSRTAMVLTEEEVLSAYIKPDHIPMLKEVQAMCDPSTSGYFYTHQTCSNGVIMRIDYRFGSSSPVILPKYAQEGLCSECPVPVRNKITAFVDQRYAFGMAFGDARDAISELNTSCGDARAMALMLPCLPTIMANISLDPESPAVKRARKLQTSTGFGALPRLPREVKDRLMEVSAIVNSVALLSDAAKPAVGKHDVVVESAYLSERAARPNIFSDPASGRPYPQAAFM